MEKSNFKTEGNMKKLSTNSYDQALKEFESSLFDSNERNTLKAKWAESTDGPDKALPEVLSKVMKDFRPRLKLAQTQ